MGEIGIDWGAVSALCSLVTTLLALLSIRTARSAQKEASRVIELTKQATLETLDGVGEKYGDSVGRAMHDALRGVLYEMERYGRRDYPPVFEDMHARLRKLEEKLGGQ